MERELLSPFVNVVFISSSLGVEINARMRGGFAARTDDLPC